MRLTIKSAESPVERDTIMTELISCNVSFEACTIPSEMRRNDPEAAVIANDDPANKYATDLPLYKIFDSNLSIFYKYTPTYFSHQLLPFETTSMSPTSSVRSIFTPLASSIFSISLFGCPYELFFPTEITAI